MNKKELVDKWTKELKKAGCTYDEMTGVFRLAKLKYERMIVDDFEKKNNVGIVVKEFPNGDVKFRVHGHLSTEADSAIEAMNKYLK